MSEMKFEVLEKTACYQGHFRLSQLRFRHQLFDGGWSEIQTRELFERGHAAVLLPYDPVRDEVVLIEQFRVGALEFPGGPWLTEIVAGVIEPGESAEEVVRREAVEEAGCAVEEIEHICNYLVSPGGTSESIALFCGKIDATGVGGIHGLDEEGEDIRVTVVSYDQSVELLKRGHITTVSPIIAMQWLMMNRTRLRAQWGV